VIDRPMFEFRKSSYSGSQGECVEVAKVPGMAVVRDSKDPQSPVLAFAPAAWLAFISQVRGGGFYDV
jgi:hypothetical protein